MKRTQIAIRRIGNSQGIVIPKPLLAQLGLEGQAEMTIERDALVLRRPAKAVRAGWAAAGALMRGGAFTGSRAAGAGFPKAGSETVRLPNMG